jgi:hypothetical protein
MFVQVGSHRGCSDRSYSSLSRRSHCKRGDLLPPDDKPPSRELWGGRGWSTVIGSAGGVAPRFLWEDSGVAALPELSSPRGLEQGRRSARVSFSRDWLFPFEDGARVAAACLIALAGVVLLWSRLMMLAQSLFGDDAFSIIRYIEAGPGAIWSASNWLPNDHMLFEFLTWATTRILGSHTEPVYRLWSVLPGIAASALVAWWLWEREDPWAAAIFTVLATAAPIYFDLGTQARGYGLASWRAR